jgi:hypothetical protein
MCYEEQKKTVMVSFPSPEGSFKRCASEPISRLITHILLTIFSLKRNLGFLSRGCIMGGQKKIRKNFEIFARSQYAAQVTGYQSVTGNRLPVTIMLQVTNIR